MSNTIAATTRRLLSITKTSPVSPCASMIASQDSPLADGDGVWWWFGAEKAASSAERAR